MQAARNIAEKSITAPNKGATQPIHNKTGGSEMMERLHIISTDLIGPVTSVARENYRFMTKYSTHYTKFKAVYFISTKDKALTALVKFMRDLVISLGLCL